MKPLIARVSVLATCAAVVGLNCPAGEARSTSVESIPLARSAATCESDKICAYPRPNFAGKPRAVDPSGVRGKCIKFPAMSVIGFGLVSVGGMDGGKSGQAFLRVYDNPNCSAKSPRHLVVVGPGEQNPHVTFPNHEARPMAIKVHWVLN